MTPLYAASARADVLVNSTGSAPNSYFTFSGNDPSDTYAGGSENGNGDDYNVGANIFTLTGFSFYGGDTDPNQTAANPNALSQYGVALEFFNLAGSRVASIQLNASKVYGIGYHTLSAADLTQAGSTVTLTGAGYFSFEPYYIGLNAYNSSTGMFDRTPPPPGRAQFTLGYGGAPTTGENNPNFSAKTNAPVSPNQYPTVTTAAYGASGDSTAQYVDYELDGTPFTSASKNPIWSATGSSTWETAGNWLTGVPNSSTSSANFVGGITTDATVTLTAAKTVAVVNFDNNQHNYTLAGTSALTLSNTSSGGLAAINSWAGSNVITCPLIFSSGLNVQAFADPSSTAPSLMFPLNTSATGTLSKSGAGTLAFAASTVGIVPLNLPSIAISGGTLALQSSAQHNNRTLLTTASLTVTTGGLNLSGNDLDDSGDSLVSINALVATGFAGGTWNGPGINSSLAASASNHLNALGVIQNNQSGSPLFTASRLFDGQNPGVSDVLVKYTYYGDANLDGKVDGSDYSRIDSAFVNNQGSNNVAVTGWFNGDFNYDSVINGSDYTLIDNAFNTQGAALTSLVASPLAYCTAEISGEQPTPVPEPVTTALLIVINGGLLSRRRRV